jgi:hypothetical protein
MRKERPIQEREDGNGETRYGDLPDEPVSRRIPIVVREGRIPQSVNLPSAWIFTKEGAFKTREDLEAMAGGEIGVLRGRRWRGISLGVSLLWCFGMSTIQ